MCGVRSPRGALKCHFALFAYYRIFAGRVQQLLYIINYERLKCSSPKAKAAGRLLLLFVEFASG